MGVFDANDKVKFLKLRKAFHNKLDNDSRSQIDVFSPGSFNAQTPIGENIIFGRIVFGRLGASSKAYKLILEVLQSLDLMSPILEIGLAAPSGLAGGYLPTSPTAKTGACQGVDQASESASDQRRIECLGHRGDGTDTVYA